MTDISTRRQSRFLLNSHGERLHISYTLLVVCSPFPDPWWRGRACGRPS